MTWWKSASSPCSHGWDSFPPQEARRLLWRWTGPPRELLTPPGAACCDRSAGDGPELQSQEAGREYRWGGVGERAPEQLTDPEKVLVTRFGNHWCCLCSASEAPHSFIRLSPCLLLTRTLVGVCVRMFWEAVGVYTRVWRGRGGGGFGAEQMELLNS